MVIHVPTVFVILLLGYGMLAVQVTLSRHELHGTVGLRTWNLGSWALLAGFVLLSLRAYVSPWLSVLYANSLLFLGITLYGQAIYQFLHGHNAPPLLWWACALGCVALLFMVEGPSNLRAVVVSSVLTVLLLPGLREILRLRQRQAHPMRMVGVTLGVTALALCVRALHAWHVPSDYGDAAHVSLVQGLSFAIAFMSMLGAGFGFILAVLERNAQRMHELATHDGLTGCINRTTFDALLANAVQRATRTLEPISLLMLDLDHFKAVNDQFGHRAGDGVLRSFAVVTREQLRISDVLARVGGEEFCAILPDTDARGAVHVAESVRAAVQTMRVDNLHGGQVGITVSAGVACMASGSTMPADQFYQRADEALYQAKIGGRNQVRCAAPDVARIP